MRKLFRIGAVFVFMVVLAAGTVWGQSLSEEQIKYVKQSTFKTLDGEEVTVGDFEGKMVLIDFWETWCSPCLESFPGMQKALDEFPEHFAVLAVTPGFADSKEDVSNFIEKNDYDFTFVMDNSDLLYKKLKMRSIPFKIFIGPDGNYIQAKLGKLPDEYQHIKNLLAQHTDAKIDA